VAYSENDEMAHNDGAVPKDEVAHKKGEAHKATKPYKDIE
jgi:hypothetical protein